MYRRRSHRLAWIMTVFVALAAIAGLGAIEWPVLCREGMVPSARLCGRFQPQPKGDSPSTLAHRSPATATLEAADDQLLKGHWDEAAAAYQAVLDQDPANALALARQAKALVYLNRTDDAVKAAEKARDIAPEQPEVRRLLALAYDWAGSSDKATGILAQVVAEAPSADAYAYLGAAYTELGRMDSALSAAQQAVTLDDLSADAHRNLGYVYEILGRTKEAVDEYRKAIDLRPEYHYLHLDLGRMYRDYGPVRNLDAALAEFQEAARLQPKDPRVYWNLGMASYTKTDYAGAVESFQKAVALNDHYAPAQQMLGWSQYTLGHYDEAIAAFSAAIEANPQSAEYYAGLGWSYLYAGKSAEAKAAFEQALALDPRSKLARDGLAKIR